jgi:hypothetical protein
LRRLLIPHGTASRLARYCEGTSGLSKQDISYFLNRTTGRRGITFDDLDDLSGFFRLSIGELLGDRKPSELSGDEQRLLQAFRVLVPSMQEHVVMLVEHLSLAPRVDRQRLTLHPSEGADIKHARISTSHEATTSDGAPRVFPAGRSDDPRALAHALRLLDEAVTLLRGDAPETAHDDVSAARSGGPHRVPHR